MPITDTAYNSYTIHPAVFDFKGQTYLFHHGGSLNMTKNGQQWNGGTGRRSVSVDYLYFNEDGTVKTFPNTNGSNPRPATVGIQVRNYDGLSKPPLDE